MKLPRRQALVVAGLAGLTTLLVGSAVLVAGAQDTSASRRGHVSQPSDAVTVVTEVQYDDTYAVVPDSVTGTSGGATDPTAAPGQAPAPVAPTAEGPTVGEDHPAGPSGPPTPPPTVSRPAPPTTVTPTTERSGDVGEHQGIEIPEDWPVGVPLPPIPAGCQQPHLEDNGVWNCGG